MVQRTVYLHIPNSLYVTSLWLLHGEACAWFLSELVNIPYGKITCQLCMQHATYFTFSLWTALQCLFKFLRFAYSTPQYSHVTPMLLNSTLSINLDGIITFRPALVVVCSIIKSNVSLVINVLLHPYLIFQSTEVPSTRP